MSTTSDASTLTTSHFAFFEASSNPPWPTPHSRPCKPWPHSGFGSQSGHDTGPFFGHTNLLVLLMSLAQERRHNTKSVMGQAAVGGSVEGFLLVRVPRFSRWY